MAHVSRAVKKTAALPLKTTAKSCLCVRQIKEVTRACCMMGHRLQPFFDFR
jgi:hypothetical protein